MSRVQPFKQGYITKAIKAAPRLSTTVPAKEGLIG
jgi:hypothetical protein